MGEKRSPNEFLKENSNFLRGTIAEGLTRHETGALAADDTQLTKFHGFYQQDDRDLRPERRRKRLEAAYAFMLRVRIPGGELTPAQWLALDDIARDYGNGTLRITTRQTFQFHGVIKSNLRRAMGAINESLLDTLAACGDVNRNVLAAVGPEASAPHAAGRALARALGDRLLPRTRAYHELWVDGELVHDGAATADFEQIYGSTYLPRKFKTVVAVPPSNDVDVFAHDLGFVAAVEDGAVTGWTITVGGGMGMTHGELNTYPVTARVLGFCRPEDAVDFAEAIVTVQRDWGDRGDRKRARLKYTIETHGLDAFRAEVERRADRTLEPARPIAFERSGDRFGWEKDAAGRWHLTLYVENGRLDPRRREGMRRIAEGHKGGFVLTPNQNMVITDVPGRRKRAIDALVAEYGLAGTTTGLRRNAMACVALPTCGLALAESERYLPTLIDELDAILDRHGLAQDEITIRMTGCPNGCARPYLAEIGVVGRTPGVYHVYLGAAFDGSRLNRLWLPDAEAAEIAPALAPLFAAYAEERAEGERFGDFLIRSGRLPAPTGAPQEFHTEP